MFGITERIGRYAKINGLEKRIEKLYDRVLDGIGRDVAYTESEMRDLIEHQNSNGSGGLLSLSNFAHSIDYFYVVQEIQGYCLERLRLMEGMIPAVEEFNRKTGKAIDAEKFRVVFDFSSEAPEMEEDAGFRESPGAAERITLIPGSYVPRYL